eukprot:829527-Prymnesium_polylepis.1
MYFVYEFNLIPKREELAPLQARGPSAGLPRSPGAARASVRARGPPPEGRVCASHPVCALRASCARAARARASCVRAFR